MRKQRLAAIVLCAGMAFGGGLTAASVLNGSPAIAQQTVPVQTEWEYQRVVMGDLYSYAGSRDQFRDEFNEIAKEGWELIQVNELSGSSGNRIATYWRRAKALSAFGY